MERFVKRKYPFLISVPHGGTTVPVPVQDRIALTGEEIRYYCDPATPDIFAFKNVAASIGTQVSRMVVDLNRPPIPLPGKDPDGVIKRRTIDGKEVYLPGRFPDIPFAQRLMMEHYFPFHQKVDELIDSRHVRIAFDCHSMLPVGSCGQNDAGKERPLICLGNNGDKSGKAKKNSVITCPQETVKELAERFRAGFGIEKEVAVNDPFSGGFIINAHYWRKGVPWIQVELNRSLYEKNGSDGRLTGRPDPAKIQELRDKVWSVLTGFWESIDTKGA
ncbi:MAG TPA: N-formylglutamate amidohydrolase [Methanoregulaceae archaeon]|nr:N-formylglutamate amidohydrolase [Methanoregulaceae archaeon]